ncbi:SMI1/KNR4 family protein [Niabella sp. CC-SYL272]|uniref:SMI1/KNR4 family protein n=1 Tax=Niabella agricola TaxID=2891571 RepID=UPI001F31C9C1|nr:SMI1/KNR4 family protein [Niabella agricola]MCF3108795.1 SMI1/KNR4 family protein [Niabella agricola]
MQATLSNLDQHLSALRPSLYPDLQPSLNETDFNILERQYRAPVPVDVRALYQWKNGQRDLSFDSFVNNSVFLPLQQALETANALSAMIGFDFRIKNWWNEAWLPLFHNGGGDYICFDADGIFTGQQGQIIEFWHAANNRNVIAPSLEAFLGSLNRYYATTPPDAFDDYFEVVPPEGFPKRFYVT